MMSFIQKKALRKYVLVIFMLLSGTVLAANLAFTHEESALTGFLIDEHCFTTKREDPGADTRGCKLMEECLTSGYGVAVLLHDGTYKFYFCDGNFFTNSKVRDGTGGQKIAYDFIKASTKENYQAVTLRGKLTNKKKLSSSDSSVLYEVFEVRSITEATAHEAAGLPKGVPEGQEHSGAESSRAKPHEAKPHEVKPHEAKSHEEADKAPQYE
ncbi:MAG: hypothetical protein LBU13_07040 [Synergistaceae bacterium]|nr:hypothetical protein [Synergistaceae bacterium]